MSDVNFKAQIVNDGDSLEIPLPRAVSESVPLREETAETPITVDENEATDSAPVPAVPADEAEQKNLSEEIVKALSGDLAKLSEQVAGLSKLFEAKILHTEHEEKIVDQMHKELQRYREDIYSQLVRPILLDVIEIRDSILRIASAYQSKPEGEQNIPLKTFEMYASDVQEILEKNNIEIFKSEVNTDFVPVRHRAIKKVPTPEESLHGKIAESLSDGYSYMEKTISPEKIAVYFYEPQQIQSETTNNEEETQNG